MKTGFKQTRVTLRRCAGALAFTALSALCFGFDGAKAGEKQNTPLVLEMKIDGEIGPILVTYMQEGLADAAHRHAAVCSDLFGSYHADRG